MDQDKTRMAFADGGVPIDPVSGNEVPPGSLPEEVRDDIKVGVSEGEYIVPADVLRYYGMKFFEDLRAEAKVALGGMEQDGRMGGEPMGGSPMAEAPMEAEDDLPFSTEELQSTDDVEMNKGGYMRGYAEAGLVTDPAAVAAENPDTQIQMDSMFGNMGSVNTGIEYLIYYGPNGEQITIQTFNGQPMSPIPPGYTRAPTAVAPITPVVTAPVTGNAVAQAQAPAPAIATNNNNDNDKPDPVKPETPEEKFQRLTDKFGGLDFSKSDAEINNKLDEQALKFSAALGLGVDKGGKVDTTNSIAKTWAAKIGIKEGSVGSDIVSSGVDAAGNAISSALGLVIPLFSAGKAIATTAQKLDNAGSLIAVLDTKLKRGQMSQQQFDAAKKEIANTFTNKDLENPRDASLLDSLLGAHGLGWGQGKQNIRNVSFLEANVGKFQVNAQGVPALTKITSTAPDNQAIVNKAQNTTPEQDAYKVATQNIVNRTGKQVIIGSVTPGGQVSEPGWTWVKNPGTNAITRTYTGTAAAGNPADAGAGVISGGNQGGDNSRKENRDFGQGQVTSGLGTSGNAPKPRPSPKPKKESIAEKVKRGGGFAKGGLMTKKK